MPTLALAAMPLSASGKAAAGGRTPPRFVASSQYAYGGVSVSDVPISKPTGTAQGDLLIWFVLCSNQTAFSANHPPTGWTTLDAGITGYQDPANTRGYYAVYHKFAGASEPATYTTPTSSGKWATIMAAYRGVAASPFAAYATVIHSGVSTYIALPSITVPLTNCLEVIFGGVRSNNTNGTAPHTPPAGFTEREDTGSVSNTIFASLHDKDLWGALGPTGIINIAQGVGSAGVVGVNLALAGV